MMQQKNNVVQVHRFFVDANFPVWPTVASGKPPSSRANFFAPTVCCSVQNAVLVTKIFLNEIDHVAPHHWWKHHKKKNGRAVMNRLFPR
jgi:hypothetical protein